MKKIKLQTIFWTVYLVVAYVSAPVLLRNRSLEDVREPNGDKAIEQNAIENKNWNEANLILGMKFVLAPIWSPITIIGKIIRK